MISCRRIAAVRNRGAVFAPQWNDHLDADCHGAVSPVLPVVVLSKDYLPTPFLSQTAPSSAYDRETHFISAVICRPTQPAGRNGPALQPVPTYHRLQRKKVRHADFRLKLNLVFPTPSAAARLSFAIILLSPPQRFEVKVVHHFAMNTRPVAPMPNAGDRRIGLSSEQNPYPDRVCDTGACEVHPGLCAWRDLWAGCGTRTSPPRCVARPPSGNTPRVLLSLVHPLP